MTLPPQWCIFSAYVEPMFRTAPRFLEEATLSFSNVWFWQAPPPPPLNYVLFRFHLSDCQSKRRQIIPPIKSTQKIKRIKQPSNQKHVCTQHLVTPKTCTKKEFALVVGTWKMVAVHQKSQFHWLFILTWSWAAPSVSYCSEKNVPTCFKSCG